MRCCLPRPPRRTIAPHAGLRLIRASGSLDRNAVTWTPFARASGEVSRASAAVGGVVVDVLSEVLKVVTLDGAIFYNAEFTAPWSFRSPNSRKLAPYFSPGGAHVIIFPLLTEGRGTAKVEEGELLTLEAGDIVVFPHGHPHILANGSPRRLVDGEKELHAILSQGLK